VWGGTLNCNVAQKALEEAERVEPSTLSFRRDLHLKRSWNVQARWEKRGSPTTGSGRGKKLGLSGKGWKEAGCGDLGVIIYDNKSETWLSGGEDDDLF